MSYLYLHFVVQPNYRTERHARRCPNLRGPTPTKHRCGRARARAPATPSTTTSSTAKIPTPSSPPSGASLRCQWGRSPTDTTPPRSPCASCGAPSWPQPRKASRPLAPFCGSGTTGVGAQAPWPLVRWGGDGGGLRGACGAQDRGSGARRSATRTPRRRRWLGGGPLATTASRHTIKGSAVVLIGVDRRSVGCDNGTN